MKIYHFRPKKDKNSLLYQVFLIVSAIMIVSLLTFGGMIVARSIIDPPKDITAPPTDVRPPPEQQQKRLDIERQTRKTTKMNKTITIVNDNRMQTPDIVVTPPSNLGGGLGISTISPMEVSGGMNLRPTTVNVFGIPSVAEKVLICLDAGPYLMSDAKGGLDTYNVIREEIKNLVNKLPSTTLFNLMAFNTELGVTTSFFQKTLTAATPFQKRMAADWINPINVSLKRIGPGPNNYTLKYPFLSQPPHSPNYNPLRANIYRVYQAAIEQGADSIYILATDWTPPDDIKLPWTASETERYRKAREKYEEQRKKMLAAQGWTEEKQLEFEQKEQKARAEGMAKARKWIQEENEKRKREGKSLYVGTPTKAMHEQKFYVRPQPAPPGIKLDPPEVKFKPYGTKGIMNFYTDNGLFKDLYISKKQRLPTVNIIIFRGKDDAWPNNKNTAIRSFAAAHTGGKIRILQGLDPIKAASAAASAPKTAAPAAEKKPENKENK